MTRSSSYAWINVEWFSSLYAFAALKHSSNVFPIYLTSIKDPPQLFTLRSLMLGAFTGMKIRPLTFMALQEYATP